MEVTDGQGQKRGPEAGPTGATDVPSGSLTPVSDRLPSQRRRTMLPPSADEGAPAGGGAMGKWRLLLAGVVGAVLALGLSFGVQAVASGSSTTYYACLQSGKLSKVGTTTPTCSTKATGVSWNSEGPPGPPGPASNCTQAPTTGAVLAGCILKGESFVGDTFTDVSLLNAWLNNADFSGANFSGSNLGEADFSGANFSNAHFSNAILNSAANATTADFTGATWSNTLCPDGTNSNNDGGTCVNNLS